VFLNLICNGIQMVLTVIEYLLLYFNAKYNVITTKTVAILFGIFSLPLLYYFQ
jgi:hypothetical protein